MSVTRMSFCAILFLGLLLLSRPFVFADPPADDCVVTCQEKKYFIFEGTAGCQEYSMPTCISCANNANKDGRCLDTLDGFPPDCAVLKDDAGKAVQITLKSSAAGCATLCTLNTGAFAQATPSTEKDPTVSTVSRFTCQPLP
jgi:hypothetical protein